jgi:branched-chain amino acid transport system substrate-binding protein
MWWNERTTFLRGTKMSGRVFGLLGVAAALCAGQASAQAIKIGVINSDSGFLAAGGAEMDPAIDLYVKLHKKDLPPGVTVEILHRDDTSAPDVGKRLAQELITRDHVNMLVGVVGSPIATAIAPVTVEAKIPFIIGNAAGVNITRLSPYIIRTSFTLWQSGYPLGKWAAQQGWKTAFTAVSDFIPGHDTEEAFTKGFTEAGGKIVGAIRFSPSSPDFPPVVQRIKDAKPDVTLVWVPAGTQATAMMKAIRDLQLREGGVKVISTQDLVPDEELPNMGDAPLGLVTAGNYSTAADRPANKEFLAAWNKEYQGKYTPDFISVGGWDAIAAAYAVIERTKGKFTSDEAMKILVNWKNPDSPRGPISIDPIERDVVQNIYMRRTEMQNGKLANVEFFTMEGVKDPWKQFNPPK